MPNQELINYFKQNLSSYSMQELKQQALSQGYQPQEVEEAARWAQGGVAVQQVSDTVNQYLPSSSKSSFKEGAISGVVVGLIFFVLRIPLSFLSTASLTASGFSLVASLVFLPVGIIVGAVLGGAYGWLIITFEDKLPGGSFFMKVLIPLLVLNGLGILMSFMTLFLNPVYTLLSDVLSILASIVFAKLFSSRMGR
ncbi:MAG TPA: hypothetical protein VJG90_04730 [Candidatus Nanoarchaeia archaeon]|nr:hypothetical protein [Candidatus Nanoarchaeia archaeon]